MKCNDMDNKHMKDLIGKITEAIGTEDEKELSRIKELDVILNDLISKMNSNIDNQEQYKRIKELYEITENRRTVMKSERTDKYNKIHKFVEESIKTT